MFLKYIGRALCVQSNRVGPADDSITAVSIVIIPFFTHYRPRINTAFMRKKYNPRHTRLWFVLVMFFLNTTCESLYVK